VGEGKTIGFESEARIVFSEHQLSGGFQLQKTDIKYSDLRGTSEYPSPSYPQAITNLGYHYKHETTGQFGVRGKYVTARRATQSNIDLNFVTPYKLDPYFVMSAVWSIDKDDHHFNVGLNNLLDTSYAEPGFNGVDFPSRKRELAFGYSTNF
jgi:hypothetical protein